MTATELLPIAAVGGLIAFMIYVLATSSAAKPSSWVFPAALSATFLIFSLITTFSEGILGFWDNHTLNLWGNQVWFDLLLAIGIGWYFVHPRAKALGMKTPFWLALILATGCIGLLAMVARYFYLRDKTASIAA